MMWGFYCRTCGASSKRWFENPRRARRMFQAVQPKLEALSRDEDVTLSAAQVPVVVFLAEHCGHDLWAECDSGVLRLAAGEPPGGDVAPPRFRRLDVPAQPVTSEPTSLTSSGRGGWGGGEGAY